MYWLIWILKRWKIRFVSIFTCILECTTVWRVRQTFQSVYIHRRVHCNSSVYKVPVVHGHNTTHAHTHTHTHTHTYTHMHTLTQAYKQSSYFTPESWYAVNVTIIHVRPADQPPQSQAKLNLVASSASCLASLSHRATTQTRGISSRFMLLNDRLCAFSNNLQQCRANTVLQVLHGMIYMSIYSHEVIGLLFSWDWGGQLTTPLHILHTTFTHTIDTIGYVVYSIYAHINKVTCFLVPPSVTSVKSRE